MGAHRRADGRRHLGEAAPQIVDVEVREVRVRANAAFGLSTYA
jgi:hypothetical protein